MKSGSRARRETFVTDGGITWSEQKSVWACGTNYEARDPAPVVYRETGDVFLVTRGLYVLKSQDDGKSDVSRRTVHTEDAAIRNAR